MLAWYLPGENPAGITICRSERISVVMWAQTGNCEIQFDVIQFVCTTIQRLVDGLPETKDLVLRKAIFDDWKDMYRNIWSREESARYMLWQVTTSEDAARDRMERTIRFQSESNSAWTVCEKKSGQAIGFAGMIPVEDGVYEDCGVAIGPEFVGQGYGKQILTAIVDYAFEELGAKKFIVSCRSQNAASRGTILSCGFTYTHSEERVDPRDGSSYVLEFYKLDHGRTLR